MSELERELGGAGVKLEVLNRIIWAWFDTHRDDVVLTLRVLVFSKTIRVRDLRPIFQQLFGPRPPNDVVSSA